MKPSFINRRQFIQKTVAASVVAPLPFSQRLLASHHGAVAGQNWAETFTYGAARFHQPATIDELRKRVRDSQRVKALGGRHSFSRIADTDADLIATSKFNQLVKLDESNRTVTVGGGMKYGELAEPLHRAGYAVHNLASLPHIQIAGAIGTATHGSGDANGNLAAPVVGLELVTADGELLRLKRGDRQFNGAVVHLGALGVITEVTLAITPTFDVQQYVYIGLTQDRLRNHFEDIFSAAYSVSVFTDWQEDPRLSTIWIKRKVDG
ncbi:MAG: FAD-binding protein, partial [Cyanothece sp. SIO1E1]|nr:FAD-binding protein [Cyanothece sp. SIO1E1]